MKYAIWNNKGGVGKTFLTYALATEHAHRNPGKSICIIDACPQANISEILLGGNGQGTTKLGTLLSETNRLTIGGYFDARLSNPDKLLGTESAYALKVDSFAPALPGNLYLVCGDPSLELQVQSMNQLASVDLPEGRWLNVHKWICDLQDGILPAHNDKVDFFIDCNPSFATYTAQALLASDRIIVPCTADGSSARAIVNVGRLLYGINVPAYYQNSGFNANINKLGISLPKIHAVINNRHTTSKEVPSKAFQAMFIEIKHQAESLKQRQPTIFVPNNSDWYKRMPDAHAVAIVASTKAIRIHELKPGNYRLPHGSTQLTLGPLERYKEQLDSIIDSLQT